MASFCERHVQELRRKQLCLAPRAQPRVVVWSEMDALVDVCLLCLGSEASLIARGVAPALDAVTLGTFQSLLAPFVALGANVRRLDAYTRAALQPGAANVTQTLEAFCARVRAQLHTFAEACMAHALFDADRSLLTLAHRLHLHMRMLELCDGLLDVAAVTSEPHRLLDELQRLCEEATLVEAPDVVAFLGQLRDATLEPYRRMTLQIVRVGVVDDPHGEYCLDARGDNVHGRAVPRWLAPIVARVAAIAKSLAALQRARHRFVDTAACDIGVDVTRFVTERHASVCSTLVRVVLLECRALVVAQRLRWFFCLESLALCDALCSGSGGGAAPILEAAQMDWLSWHAPEGQFVVSPAMAGSTAGCLCSAPIMAMYNNVQRFLLQLYSCRATLSTRALPLRGRSMALLRFRQRALWTINAIMDCICMRLREDDWASIAPTLQSAYDLDAVIASYAAYVQRLYDVCFQSAKPLSYAIVQLVECCTQWSTLYHGGGVVHDAAADITRLDAAFAHHVHVLKTILTGVLAQRSILALAVLLGSLQ